MWIGINNLLINSILSFATIWFFLTNGYKVGFFMGAFIALFLFHFIAFSLYYYELLYLAPLFFIALFLTYGFIFGVLAYIKERFFWLGAILLIFWFDFFEPFGFNWLKPEVMFSYSYFGVHKWQFALMVLSASLLIKLRCGLKFLTILPLVFAINFEKELALPDLKIKLISTDISQSVKWTSGFQSEAINSNFIAIDNAAKENYELVVLPETAFPFALNLADDVIDILKDRSYDIAILAGSLRVDENKNIYNTSYFFKDGQMQMFDKVVAVPFGEQTNFAPAFMRDYINELFFDGAKDYETAKSPSDFSLKNYEFRNAICYEATKDELYSGNPKYLIAMSNNAWFVPSIEPYYQKALMKYYSRKHNTVIYHSVNKSEAFVVY